MDSPFGEQAVHFVHQQRFRVGAVSSQQLWKQKVTERNSSQGIDTIIIYYNILCIFCLVVSICSGRMMSI